jgi:hypothetical protein
VSIELAVVAMAVLMALVFMCTIAQVTMGTYGAVEHFMRHFLVWAKPYSITLKKFTHGLYLGTDIPKDFSSLVHISNPPRAKSAMSSST